MHDVAENAKVSIATVSHVINATRPVAPDTEARVRASIEALGYRPNRLAQSLRTATTKTFAMLVPDNANPFFAEMARGVEDAAFSAGYGVMLGNTDGSTAKETLYGDWLVDSMIAGVVLITAGTSSELIDLLRAREIPVVLVDRELGRDDVDAVIPRHFDGACEATEHLLGLGHKRIACIASSTTVLSAEERLRGFKVAMESAGETGQVENGDFRFEGGYRAATRLLDRRERPEAIFACNDLMAMGALRAATELGISVPNDLSIVGFDDIALARFTTPALSTVAQPMLEMGSLATELLLRRIADRSIPVDRRLVDTALVVRESSIAHKSRL